MEVIGLYINTSTKESIESSVLELLNINHDELYSLLEECYQRYAVDHQVFMLDDQYDLFYSFVKENMKTVLDQVMLIHLSRRIDNGDDNGYGLIDMLTKDNTLSSFLREYGISFKCEDNQIKIYVNDQEVDIKDKESYGYKKLQQKIDLKYDIEFSGYALKHNIDKLREYSVLMEGPDILSFLFLLGVDDNHIIDTFTEKSHFYQLEYVVPLNQITIDDYEDLDDLEKQYHLVVKAIQRLYLYKYDKDFIGEDCSILRMKDNQILDSKYLINKVKL